MKRGEQKPTAMTESTTPDVALLIPAAINRVIHVGSVDDVRRRRLVEEASMPGSANADRVRWATKQRDSDSVLS